MHLGPADTTSPPEGTLDTSDQADFTLVNPKYIHIYAQTQTDTHLEHFLGTSGDTSLDQKTPLKCQKSKLEITKDQVSPCNDSPRYPCELSKVNKLVGVSCVEV